MSEKLGQSKRCLISPEVHQCLLAVIKDKGLSNAAIARELGIDRETVSKVIANQPDNPFHFSTAEKILEAYEIRYKDSDILDVTVTRQSPLISVDNPFEGQAAVEDLSYHARREELLRQIFEELDKGSNRNLVGESRVGKTWLLRQICERGKFKMKRQVDGFIYLDMRCIEDGKDFFEALCLELKIDPPVRGYKLKLALEGRQYILCLDEIDQLADDQRFTRVQRDQLCSLCDGRDMPLSLVIASQVSLNTLFPDSPNRSSTLVGICRQIDVNLISLEQTREFVLTRLRGTGFQFSEVTIKKLHQDCRGRPDWLLDTAAKYYRAMMRST